MSLPGLDDRGQTDFVVTRAPDYGLDAPGVVRNLALGGLGSLVVGLSAARLRGTLVAAACLLGEAGYMVWSSRVGKLRRRDGLLDAAAWRGDERVLDVGCGSGLLLVGAARRLIHGGRAVGLDLWSARDLSDNHAERTRANAAAEDVAGRVAIHTGDMRAMPFATGAFDLVVSSMAVHNLPTAADRAAAIAEIARVLAPEGRMLVQDFRHTRTYARTAAAAGLVDVARSRPYFTIFPPVRVVSARKPAA